MRSVTLLQLMNARYKMYQALGAEDWAAQNPEMTVVEYPPGVQPSVDQIDSLEVLEEIYIRETPPATP